MASLTQWTWVWVYSGSWWWTGKPDVLQSMRSQRVGHQVVGLTGGLRGCTELNDLGWVPSSLSLFPSWPRSFPASRSFPMSWLFTSVAKVLELQLQHQSFQWILYSELISFRTDWFDLLVVQGTLKSLLQHHSSKASILRRSTFFVVQLSHPYVTTGKAIALTRRTFVGKVKSLLFNVLSSLVIAFLPRSKHLLILWLQSSSAVILEPSKIKSLTVSFVSHLFAMKWWGWMPWS